MRTYIRVYVYINFAKLSTFFLSKMTAIIVRNFLQNYVGVKFQNIYIKHLPMFMFQAKNIFRVAFGIMGL